MSNLSRLVITPGEPAGIGPDICIQLIQQAIKVKLAFIADPELIQHRARELGLPIQLVTVTSSQEIPEHEAGHFPIFPISCKTTTISGRLDQANASYVTQTLDLAVDLIARKQFDALVTAPVHKGIINEAGITFTGHTEWLADLTHTKLPVMMLASDKFRVALVTTHLPLQNVSQAITSDRLEAVIRILNQALRERFHIKQPRIRVCGLNPHAGEDGHMGMEEIDIIQPVILKLKQEGLNITGPVPADTAFLPDTLKDADVILAMYHDQGLPVLKYSGFENGINITLGLPIIRTSVDHGTALELAGTGKANPASLIAAVNQAIEMTTLNNDG